jgi:hypothetical protein
MPNPGFLFCDTDALIQAYLTGCLEPLRLLRKSYGVEAAIVPEVESELLWNTSFGDRFGPDLQKSISSGLITVFDYSKPGLRGPGQIGPPAALAALSATIIARAEKYKLHADLGEAYTLATAVTMSCPAMSGDMSAIGALLRASHEVPSPVLRFYDLVVFGYQIGVLTDGDCDRIRQVLVAEDEHLPRDFRNKAFIAGLARFTPRLLDKEQPRVGANSPPTLPYQQVLLITGH